MKVITDSKQLENACRDLHRAAYITVDTEFQRNNTYWPQLCLIQIAGPDDAFIIDALSEGLSMEPFYDLMGNEKVLKVFHAARQDLEIFLHEANRLPHPIFDTQIAAMVCGFGDSVGYETLVSKLANAHIDKSSRFTDWSRRPLSSRQLQYAIGDVTHLRVIYEKLADRLEQNGRTAWLKEEMDELTSPSTYQTHPEDAWLRLKTKSQNTRFLAVLRAVAGWRETRAQTLDIPRNRVIRDDVVLELAAHPPTKLKDLKGVRSLPSSISNSRTHGGALVDAITDALALPADRHPTPKAVRRLPRGLGPTVELLKVLLKQKCEDSEVAQKLVANVSDLEEIAADDNADVHALHGWRRELFGKDALALKHGRLALTVKRGAVVVIKTPPSDKAKRRQRPNHE